MKTLEEAISRPWDYTAKEFDAITSEYRGLLWHDQSLGHTIVTEFHTSRRLSLYRKRYYPELNIENLIHRFSGEFGIDNDK